MTNEIKEILSLYNTILENRKVLSLMEITTVPLNKTNYSNVKYDKDSTQYDEVNKSLLDDLQKASQKANVVSTITTASSGHSTKTVTGNQSRHPYKTAVDIAMLNNISSNATSSSDGNAQFRELGNKLKDALVSMGYSWNTETGKSKSVIWQTSVSGNHFNHLHVSNTESVGTSAGDYNPSDTSKTNISPKQIGADIKYFEPKQINPDMNYFPTSVQNEGNYLVKEDKIYGSFGNDIINNTYNIKIPKDKNTKIKSPVDGTIQKKEYSFNCINQLDIIHEIDDHKFFLRYCGLKKTKPFGPVSQGTVIGEVGEEDITVTLYNSSNERVPIDYYKQKEISKNRKKSNLTKKRFLKPDELFFTKSNIDSNRTFFEPRDIQLDKIYFPKKKI